MQVQKRRSSARTVRIGKRKTTVSVEDVFWNALREIAKRRRRPLHRILQDIAMTADEGLGLSSAIRVFIFQHFYDVAHGQQI
ncbi:ribbon-helix-helix domain-containing protein [Hyphomicrobium sp.]|uniref:ribbon-helix-helix domain-containing protein n=1 Tax=Hyphomicrobium sp. TaxID=82 RepID=UPI002FE20400